MSWAFLQAQSESQSRSVVSGSFRIHGLYSPWTSPGQNTAVGSLSLLQGIFPTQGWSPGLPHCRRILYCRSHREGEWLEISGIELLGALLRMGSQNLLWPGLRLSLAQKFGGEPQGGGRDPPSDHTPQHPLLHPGQFGPSRPQDRVSHRKVSEARLALGGPPPAAPSPEAAPVGVRVGRGGIPPRRRVRLRPPGRLFSPGGAGALAPARLWAQGDGGGARTTCRRLSRPLPVGDPRQLTNRLQSTPRGACGNVAGLGPPPTPARLAAPSSPARMARLLTVTLGCISLLYLQLPGALSLSLAGSRPPTGHR